MVPTPPLSFLCSYRKRNNLLFLFSSSLFSDDLDNNEEYNHLKLIIELCGNFNLEYLKTTKYYKKYFDKNGNLKDFKLSDTRNIKEKLYEKLKDKGIDDVHNCIDLLSKMIKFLILVVVMVEILLS